MIKASRKSSKGKKNVGDVSEITLQQQKFRYESFKAELQRVGSARNSFPVSSFCNVLPILEK